MLFSKQTLIVLLTILSVNIALSQSEFPVQDSPISELDLALISNTQTGETQQVKLSDYNGKIRILDFWATWCGPCIEKMAELKKLKNQFPNDLEIISISDEKIEKILPFVQKQSLPFQFVVDSGSVISNRFGVAALPFTILLDKKGIIKVINNSSAITPEIMRNLIADKPVNFPKPPKIVISNIADTAQKNVQNRRVFTNYKPDTQPFAKDEADGEYAGRRIAIYNLKLSQMVGMLSNWYQQRMFFSETIDENKDQLYCLDFIFDEKNAAQRANLALEFLAKRFPEKIKVRSEIVKGYALQVGNKTKIPAKAEGNEQFISTATTEDLSTELSRLLKIPVKNETTFNYRFVLTMNRIPEDKVIIKRILERIGLVLVEKEITLKRYGL
ncbi:MAG: TlpA disulfide reductase family protein [Arcicella sp.]|nr:TlpA disulfide reductase family protein [Arcicella sp.]